MEWTYHYPPIPYMHNFRMHPKFLSHCTALHHSPWSSGRITPSPHSVSVTPAGEMVAGITQGAGAFAATTSSSLEDLRWCCHLIFLMDLEPSGTRANYLPLIQNLNQQITKPLRLSWYSYAVVFFVSHGMNFWAFSKEKCIWGIRWLLIPHKVWHQNMAYFSKVWLLTKHTKR